MATKVSEIVLRANLSRSRGGFGNLSKVRGRTRRSTPRKFATARGARGRMTDRPPQQRRSLQWNYDALCVHRDLYRELPHLTAEPRRCHGRPSAAHA